VYIYGWRRGYVVERDQNQTVSKLFCFSQTKRPTVKRLSCFS